MVTLARTADALRRMQSTTRHSLPLTALLSANKAPSPW